MNEDNLSNDKIVIVSENSPFIKFGAKPGSEVYIRSKNGVCNIAIDLTRAGMKYAALSEVRKMVKDYTPNDLPVEVWQVTQIEEEDR